MGGGGVTNRLEGAPNGRLRHPDEGAEAGEETRKRGGGSMGEGAGGRRREWDAGRGFYGEKNERRGVVNGRPRWMGGERRASGSAV